MAEQTCHQMAEQIKLGVCARSCEIYCPSIMSIVVAPIEQTTVTDDYSVN